MEIFQIAKMTTNHKHTALSIGYKITTCECLENGSSKSEITCEYKITISCIAICLIIDYLNKSWSQGVLIIEGALYQHNGLTLV